MLARSLAHSRARALSRSLSHALPPCCSFSPTLTHARFLSHSLSLSLSLARARARALSLARSLALSLSLSPPALGKYQHDRDDWKRISKVRVLIRLLHSKRTQSIVREHIL